MQHKDFIKAAKDLNIKAQTKLKVVAVKGDVLKKSIQDAVKGLVDFDFSTLESGTLDVFDELKCEITESKPKKAKVIPINKNGEALIAAAKDLIDFLGFPESALAKFEVLPVDKMIKELQKMADEINVPYAEDGKTVTPDDKPEDFKPLTIEVFEANDITVNWNEVKEETKQKEDKKPDTSKKEKKAPIKKEKPELQFHKYADLFPETDEETVDSIVKDMNENGFRTDRPIILFAGRIADGRTRYKCANIVGIDAAYTNFDGTEDELFKHVIALNLKRRHLTPGQRAALATEFLPELEKAAKEEMSKAGKKTTGKKQGEGKSNSPSSERTEQSRDKAAKMTGSTGKAVSEMKKIKKEAPEKFEEVKQGKKTIAAAKRETETKTAMDIFNDSEKAVKAKLKMVVKSIHELIDAAEVAEQTVTYQDDLDLIENSVLRILG